MFAEGDCGWKVTERATKMAVQKATVVKNPKEFWSLTSVECIFDR